MAERDEERDASTERVADDVRPLELHMLDERGDVLGHELRADRAIDVRSPPMRLQIDADHLVALRQYGQVGSEHLDRAEPAVQQDQRSAGPVDLVVELDAVHVGVVAFAFRLASPLALLVALDIC